MTMLPFFVHCPAAIHGAAGRQRQTALLIQTDSAHFRCNIVDESFVMFNKQHGRLVFKYQRFYLKS